MRGALPSRIMLSGPSARFLQNGNQIVPVLLSTTGQGLPQVVAGSVTTVWVGSQVWPPSKLRFKIRSMSPVSLRECRRPSQKRQQRSPCGDDHRRDAIRVVALLPADKQVRLCQHACTSQLDVVNQ